jgi:hypothetical protein
MMRFASTIAVCALLGACATPGAVNTPHAQLERAETAAELAYQAAVPNLSEAQKAIAWADLQRVRKLYNAGQDITAAAAQVQSDTAAAKGAK